MIENSIDLPYEAYNRLPCVFPTKMKAYSYAYAQTLFNHYSWLLQMTSYNCSMDEWISKYNTICNNMDETQKSVKAKKKNTVNSL